MNIAHLRPIPENVKERIAYYDVQYQCYANLTRYYAYLDMLDGDLVKVTVAVKMNDLKDRVYKQVTVHPLHGTTVFAKDFARHYIAGYITGWHREGLSKRLHSFEDGEWGYDDKGGFDIFAHVVNLNYLHRTRYKYSGGVEYGSDNILAYLRVWEEFPQVELLSKIGLGHLAFRKTLLRRAVKDKAFVRWLIEHKEDIRNSKWKARNILYAYEHKMNVVDYEDILFFTESALNGTSYIRQVFPESEYLQLAQYLKKQDLSAHIFDDYLKACLYLGLDMTLSKNRYPHELKKWHDLRTLEYASKKAEEEEKQKNKIAEGVTKMAERYAFLETGNEHYTVFIAKSKKELSIEGEYLHHCVGRMGYDTKIAEGRSLIFFLRLAEEPTIPFVTIEYDLEGMRIAQYHGRENRAPEKEVRDYIEKTWVPMVTKQLKKNKQAA